MSKVVLAYNFAAARRYMKSVPGEGHGWVPFCAESHRDVLRGRRELELVLTPGWYDIPNVEDALAKLIENPHTLKESHREAVEGILEFRLGNSGPPIGRLNAIRNSFIVPNDLVE